MIKVVQAYPSPGTKPQEADCESAEDVYNIPFVQRWLDDPTFWKLCKATVDQEPHLLVVETTKGKMHWHIGYLEGDIANLSLPEWQRQK
jgi:hypothetical protein